MPHYRICPKDANGDPLEEVILKTAEENIVMLTRYREREIGCESTIHGLLQSVVEAASRAYRRRKIRNPAAYLISAYQHAADKLLDRENRIVLMDSASLELIQIAPSVSWEDEVHRRLVLEKIMRAMDSETRRIAGLRLEGYSMDEIGRMLSKSPRRIYFRYRREVHKAVRKALGFPPIGPRNPP